MWSVTKETFNLNYKKMKWEEFYTSFETWQQRNAEQQKCLIKKMIEELNLDKIPFKKSSNYRNSVWFIPETGRFLFNDQFVYYDLIELLIKNKSIEYVGMENHQGEKMLRYRLTTSKSSPKLKNDLTKNNPQKRTPPTEKS